MFLVSTECQWPEWILIEQAHQNANDVKEWGDGKVVCQTFLQGKTALVWVGRVRQAGRQAGELLAYMYPQFYRKGCVKKSLPKHFFGPNPLQS